MIIAPPPTEDGINVSLEYLQPYWAELENLVQNKKIVAIGTSDLDKALLEQLFLWAQVRGRLFKREPGTIFFVVTIFRVQS